LKHYYHKKITKTRNPVRKPELDVLNRHNAFQQCTLDNFYLLDSIKIKKMTIEQEQYIRTNLKWPLTWVLIVKCFLIFCIAAVSVYAFKSYLDNSTNYSNLIVFIFGFSLSVFAVIRIHSERQFIRLNLNQKLTMTVVKQKIKTLNWIDLHKGLDKMEFLDKGGFFTGNVYITIIVLPENELLINTRPEKQPFTINRDIVNYKKIRLLLGKVN